MPLDSTVIQNIRTSVALSSLNISVFTGERVDRRVTDEVADKHGTDARDSGRYVKKIVSKSSLEHINRIAGAARVWFYEATLPGFDQGSRMFNMRGYEPLVEQARRYKQEFDKAVDDFIRIYPDLIEEARQRLNGMFREDDYPNIAGMRDNFNFSFRIMPMPDVQNWFLDNVGEEMAALKAEAEDNIRNTLREGVKDVYERIFKRVQVMAQKLDNYSVDPETGKASGIFRNSLVENVRELITILPTLNVTNDPDLNEMGQRLRELVLHDADALRADEQFRRDVAEKARQIASAAEKFL